ncbi:MAG: virulence RhuM family protein [Mariniphaga sp.]|nr:virulence RhuM family protein [Mariniphaga sp.]
MAQNSPIGELDETLCTQKFGISEFQQKAPNYYNLDVIISVGYRVKSFRGTQFRQWATKRKTYLTSLTSEKAKPRTRNILIFAP